MIKNQLFIGDRNVAYPPTGKKTYFTWNTFRRHLCTCLNHCCSYILIPIIILLVLNCSHTSSLLIILVVLLLGCAVKYHFLFNSPFILSHPRLAIISQSLCLWKNGWKTSRRLVGPDPKLAVAPGFFGLPNCFQWRFVECTRYWNYIILIT